MRYQIKTWIPVEPEKPETFNTKEEAEKEAEQLRFLQPENIYEVAEKVFKE